MRDRNASFLHNAIFCGRDRDVILDADVVSNPLEVLAPHQCLNCYVWGVEGPSQILQSHFKWKFLQKETSQTSQRDCIELFYWRGAD